jgi:hypothetical protein
MGIFDKILGGKKESIGLETPPCPHAVLLPRWDSVADMGIEDRVTSFTCESCHEVFSPGDARELQSASLTDKLVGQSGDDSV